MPIETGGRLADYLTGLVPPRGEELRVMEKYAEDNKFPIIGPTAGYFCYQIARMINATRIFELGSGYGYSTAWFARAVRENGGGVVYHVVWDDELSRSARVHMEMLGYGDVVQYRVGEAVENLRATEDVFDLIFNDIDKHGYPDSLPAITEKLRSGGVLIVDNAIWGGRVLDEMDHGASVQAVRKLTSMLTADQAWITSIVPIRDGLLVAVKR